jgi:hypothetical protein
VFQRIFVPKTGKVTRGQNIFLSEGLRNPYLFITCNLGERIKQDEVGGMCSTRRKGEE